MDKNQRIKLQPKDFNRSRLRRGAVALLSRLWVPAMLCVPAMLSVPVMSGCTIEPPAPVDDTRVTCHCECQDVCLDANVMGDSSWCYEWKMVVPDNKCDVCLGPNAQQDPARACTDYCESIRVGVVGSGSGWERYGHCRAVSSPPNHLVTNVISMACDAPGASVYGLQETSYGQHRTASCDTEGTYLDGSTRGSVVSPPTSNVVLDPAQSTTTMAMQGYSSGILSTSGQLRIRDGDCFGATCPFTINLLELMLPNFSVEGYTISSASVRNTAEIHGTLGLDGSFVLPGSSVTMGGYATFDGTRTKLDFVGQGNVTGRYDAAAGQWRLSGTLASEQGTLRMNLVGFTAPRKGDANGDGAIDILDALLCAQHSAGLAPSPFFERAADVNCDGQADVIDAQIISRYAAGLIQEFTCGA